MQSGSVLQLLHRLRGGGGDGGATGAESRSSYLEMYMDKKPDKVHMFRAVVFGDTFCAYRALLMLRSTALTSR